VALAWAGNAAHMNDRHRSVVFEKLLPLLSTAGISFIGIQRELREHDAKWIAEQTQLEQLGTELADFEDTAAVIALCDLVITVDTSVAHLAAAMGANTWILLPFWPDWRWTLTGEHSPWYPGARLFRQGADNDWGPVIARVKSALETL
jgi:ADP-heptose:LPS heptosyltransferase